MRKNFILLIAAAMAMTMISVSTASAYDIILTLDADTYEIGDTVTASVVWTGLTAVPGLYVWLMDIEYDESILQYTGEESITWGPDWANSYPVPGVAGNLALTGSNGEYGGIYGDPNLMFSIELKAIGTGDITVTMIHHDDSGMNNMLADYTMVDDQMEFFGDTATVLSGSGDQFSLTVNTSGSGTVTRDPSGGAYDAGTVVTLTATPDAGWTFSGWSGDISGMDNPATITMDANKTVTATFSSDLADQDQDGIADDEDNCPKAYNPDQADADGDQFGDACDGRPDDPNWVTIEAGISYDGIDLCAMVLANGKHMFTCGESLGVYDLDVPLDENGEITLYGFSSGRAPFKQVLTPKQAQHFDIAMIDAGPNVKEMTVDINTEESAEKPGCIRMIGTIMYDTTPLCTMALANGQSMFTCGGENQGAFDLTVPLDGNGKITFYVFCSGMAPYKNIFAP